MGILVQGAMLIAVGIAQAVRMNLSGSFQLGTYALTIALIFVMSSVASSISLPFMFRWGVEKGRIAYYAMIGFVCAGGYLGSVFFTSGTGLESSPRVIPVVLLLAGTAVYAISWLASISLFNRREVV